MSDEDAEISEGETVEARGTARAVDPESRTSRGPAWREGDAAPQDEPAQDTEPDVLLAVPGLRADEIDLHVEDLKGKVSLHAEVLGLLRLDVGADVSLGSVELNIKGLDLEALLKVRLDSVLAAVERLLTSVDRNPQILERLTASMDPAVRDAGRISSAGSEGLDEDAGRAIEGVTRTTRRATERGGRRAEGMPGEAERRADRPRRRAEDAGDRRPRRPKEP